MNESSILLFSNLFKNKTNENNLLPSRELKFEKTQNNIITARIKHIFRNFECFFTIKTSSTSIWIVLYAWYYFRVPTNNCVQNDDIKKDFGIVEHSSRVHRTSYQYGENNNNWTTSV